MRNLILELASALALITAPALAQTPQSDWLADLSNGCRVWNAAPKANETVTWDGPCRDGLANGHGLAQWYADGVLDASYEGELKDGKMSGYGVIRMGNGDLFVGDFREGVASGGGVLVSNDGTTLAGIWSDGCFTDKNYAGSVNRGLGRCANPIGARDISR